MAEQSRIEWTDTTWNVVTGCTKVSPGCDRCYAETFAERWRGIPGHHFTTGFDLTLRPERLGLPLRWRRPRRIFVNSMADLFHDQVPDGYIASVFAVMAATVRHTFQVLTKRHARMRSLLTSPAFRNLVTREYQAIAGEGVDTNEGTDPGRVWPLPNVWLGVSVETQQWADIRLPALAQTPAVLRFTSCEPLLGPLDLSTWLRLEFAEHGSWVTTRTDRDEQGLGLDWLIIGGESGHAARPVDEWWFGDLIDQADAAGIPVFVKQLGTAWDRQHGHPGKADNPAHWPTGLRIRHLPRQTSPAGGGPLGGGW